MLFDRFIPDDTTFDHEPKDVAMEMPDTAQYKPMEFQTAALTHSKVLLTWDENDRRRARQTAEVFSSKNMEDMESHIQAYLASSSEDEDEEEDKEEEEKEDRDSENGEK